VELRVTRRTLTPRLLAGEGSLCSNRLEYASLMIPSFVQVLDPFRRIDTNVRSWIQTTLFDLCGPCRALELLRRAFESLIRWPAAISPARMAGQILSRAAHFHENGCACSAICLRTDRPCSDALRYTTIGGLVVDRDLVVVLDAVDRDLEVELRPSRRAVSPVS